MLYFDKQKLSAFILETEKQKPKEKS